MATMTGLLYYTKPGIVGKVEDFPKTRGIVYGGSAAKPNCIFVASIKLLGIHLEEVVLPYGGGADAHCGFLAGEINMASE